MHFEDWMKFAVNVFEAAGVAILAIGSLVALVHAGHVAWRGDPAIAYAGARRHVGHVIILGLEVLIIADIVQTVTIDSTAESALILVVIVLLRTFLSFSLEIELEGTVPWRRRALTGDRSTERTRPDESLADGAPKDARPAAIDR
jgi:uncharacterized membrane protein